MNDAMPETDIGQRLDKIEALIKGKVVPVRFLDVSEVIERTKRSRSTLYKMWVAGDFPKPIKQGHSSIVFVESEVNEWMTKQAGLPRE